MRKAIGVLIAILTLTASAQPVQVQLILRSPAPGALPVWASDPSIVQIILRNTTATLYDGAVASFTITRLPAGTMVARSKDFHPLQPRFTIPPNGTVVLNGPQIIHESAIRIEDEALRQQAQATGQLPEGTYQFCLRVLDARGQEIGSTGAICPQTVVMLPDPPMLIHPRNDSTLAAGALPMFIWAPVTGAAPSVGPITYTLRVVPLFPGQAPQDALDRNAPVINTSGLNVPLYQYVPTDIPFTAFPQAIGFVWQVSALDMSGRPATRNNGKSEIFRFRFASRSAGTSSLGDTTVVSQQTDTLAQNRTQLPAEAGTVINRIAVPNGFTIVTEDGIPCPSPPCTISGRGRLFVPLLQDSIVVSFRNIAVGQPDGRGLSRLVGGRIDVPVGTSLQFGLLTLAVRDLVVTPEAVVLNGAWIAQWDQWDWSCRTLDSVSIVQMPFSAHGLPRHTIPLRQPWICSGDGVLLGPCIEVRFDTLDVRVDVDTAGLPPAVVPHLIARGEVSVPCIVSQGVPLHRRLQVRLDRGKPGLIATIPSPIRDAHVLGQPHFRFDADSLVIDLSSQANPVAFPPMGLCEQPGWSDPRWRGVVAPSLRARVVVGGDTLSASGSAIFDQGAGQQMSVSLVAASSAPDTLSVAGFLVSTDSITVRLCQGTLYGISARGVVQMPAALQRLPSWTALDSINVRLVAFDDGSLWRWNALLSLPTGTVAVRAGQFLGVMLRDPRFEIIEPPMGMRRGYLEFTSVHIHIPATAVASSADLHGLKIWNTGEIELSADAHGEMLAERNSSVLFGADTLKQIATGVRWVSPLSFPLVSDSSLLLSYQIENTGEQPIPPTTGFDVNVGAYVELPDGTRQFVVERQQYVLPSPLLPRSSQPMSHSLWLPPQSRILGIWTRILPRFPLVESDGAANNTVSRGQIPPLGQVGR